jgi:hypothetical protein
VRNRTSGKARPQFFAYSSLAHRAPDGVKSAETAFERPGWACLIPPAVGELLGNIFFELSGAV